MRHQRSRRRFAAPHGRGAGRRTPASPPADPGTKGAGKPNWKDKTIFTGDNLVVLRGMNSDSVDLIYLDPPFNSNRNYSAPLGSKAAGAAFKDTWTLSDVDKAWHEQLRHDHPALHDVILAAWAAAGKGTASYLMMMSVRLLEMKRVLKPSGSIYLHCDDTEGAYLKMLMDAIFGRKAFRNEIIWKRTAGRSDAKKFGRVHDVILYYAGEGATWNTQYLPHDPEYVQRAYSKEDERGRWRVHDLTAPGRGNGSPAYYEPWKGVSVPAGRMWNAPAKGGMSDWIREHVLPDWPDGYPTIKDKLDALDENGLVHWPKRGTMPGLKRYLASSKGRAVEDIFSDIGKLEANAKEKVDYPTQKPLALLERIIAASSNEGDVVLDPFCGCATAPVAAEKLGRRWAGIDLSEMANDLVRHRFRNELQLMSELTSHRTVTGRGAERLMRTDLEKPPPYRTHKKALFGEQEGFCAGCGYDFGIDDLEVDHIIAQGVGGTDHKANLQLLCRRCNSRKGSGEMSELIAELVEDRIGQYA